MLASACRLRILKLNLFINIISARLTKGELNMKKKNILILIFIIVNFVIISIWFGLTDNVTAIENNNNVEDRLEKIREKGVLTVASSNDEPASFIDSKTKQLTGIDGDIITQVAKRLGVDKVQIKEVPFESLFNQIQIDDDIDVIADGTYVTDDRREKVLFTNKWYKDFDTIITPKVSKIVFKEDLKNASVIGVPVGTVMEEVAQKLKNEGMIKDIILFPNQNELLEAVNAGKVDAGISDAITVSYALSQNKSLYIKILSENEYTPENPRQVAAAVRKSDVTLVNAINEIVDDMKKKGTIVNILEKYGLDERFYIPIEDEKIE